MRSHRTSPTRSNPPSRKRRFFPRSGSFYGSNLCRIQGWTKDAMNLWLFFLFSESAGRAHPPEPSSEPRNCSRPGTGIHGQERPEPPVPPKTTVPSKQRALRSHPAPKQSSGPFPHPKKSSDPAAEEHPRWGHAPG